MRKILVTLALVLCATTLTGCYERVEPGNVGIIVNKLGDEKGVENEVKGVGKYWIGWNEELFTFPTFKQMKTYDNVFNFQMSDGTTIGYQIGVAYRVNPVKVATIFQTYRKGVDEITDTDLKQKIADSLNRLASRMSTDKFIDGGKADLLNQSLKDIQGEMTPIGIEVISLSYIGKPEYPDTVIASINAKVTANQTTLQREQEVKQRQAEADMARAQAAGEADAKRAQAQAEADAVLMAAKAEADAINLRGKALRDNPDILKLNTVEKWNGQLPTYMTEGSQMPFVTVPAGK